MGPPDPLPAGWAVGQHFTLDGTGGTSWSVIGTGQRLVEVVAGTACGRLGIGVRVIGLHGERPAGGARSRVVFVGRLEPAGSRIKARLRDLPTLRRRFDRWALQLRRLTS